MPSCRPPGDTYLYTRSSGSGGDIYPYTRSSGSGGDIYPFTRSSGSGGDTYPCSRSSGSGGDTYRYTRSSGSGGGTYPYTRSSGCGGDTYPYTRSSGSDGDTYPDPYILRVPLVLYCFLLLLYPAHIFREEWRFQLPMLIGCAVACVDSLQVNLDEWSQVLNYLANVVWYRQ